MGRSSQLELCWERRKPFSQGYSCYSLSCWRSNECRWPFRVDSSRLLLWSSWAAVTWSGQNGQHRPHLHPLAPWFPPRFRQAGLHMSHAFLLVPLSAYPFLPVTHSPFASVIPSYSVHSTTHIPCPPMASFLAPLAQTQLFHWFLISVRALGCMDRKPNSNRLEQGNLWAHVIRKPISKFGEAQSSSSADVPKDSLFLHHSA